MENERFIKKGGCGLRASFQAGVPFFLGSSDAGRDPGPSPLLFQSMLCVSVGMFRLATGAALVTAGRTARPRRRPLGKPLPRGDVCGVAGRFGDLRCVGDFEGFAAFFGEGNAALGEGCGGGAAARKHSVVSLTTFRGQSALDGIEPSLRSTFPRNVQKPSTNSPGA